MSEPVRALVVHASRYGSTAEIAEAVGAALRDLGIAADVVPAAEVAEVEPYDIVVIGSAVYLGRWRPDARRFISRFEAALAERSVWLFSSGPLDRSRDGEDRDAPRDVAALADRIGAREHEWFGGLLSPEADGVLEWLIIRTGRAGDFRDFARIRSWAARIAGSRAEAGEPIAAR
ncbi:MAG TPA: flavodoxin domain-containing protein [Candidatus Dormibacteraeota bacterium]|nr:flavodoxin domain-containing protein [Candidatus Dormibacteraeota bacterium]